MYSTNIKNQAQQLRSQGKTYSEIKAALGLTVPKSTISSWCQKVILPEWYEAKIAKLNTKNFKKAQQFAHAQLEKKRELHLASIEKEAATTLNNFNLAGLKIALAMLYLGEGAKWQGHSGLMLGSSDPEIILLYISLLQECYGIEDKTLKCRISYRADQNIEDLEQYWSHVTQIPLKNFYKTKADPRTQGKKTQKLDYKGVCVIMGGGSNIQLELEMLAKFLLKKIKGL